MNGAHDLGGMHGFGPVDPEVDEPVFHDDWERRCFAITLAAGLLGEWNIDMSRYARERMDPALYLRTSYYEHWLHGLHTLLVERGLLTEEEIEARMKAPESRGEGHGQGPRKSSRKGDVPNKRAFPAAEIEVALKKGGPARVDVDVDAKFAPGDRVVTRNIHPMCHTRLPRYARARRGAVERDHGVFIFPDTNALGLGKKPQHLYSVRFAARELFGPDAAERDSVRLDLWDDYLDPA